VQPLINFLKHNIHSLTLFKQDTQDLASILLYCSLRKHFTGFGGVKESLHELRQHYSPEWITFLTGILDQNVNRRPDPLSIRVLPNGTLTILNLHEEY